MDVVFLRSVNNTPSKDKFSVRMNTGFADRVLGHLSDDGNYCSSCQGRCIGCRSAYDLQLSAYITAVLEFPATLPAIIEEPEQFLPDTVEPHDILVAIAVNEEILISFIERFPIAKGIIIPIEERNWISPNGIVQITDICRQKAIEVSFPKPFCAFDPHKDTILYEFKERFKIGRPDIEFVLDNDLIAEATVRCSAPCGATYYIARWLKGNKIDQNLSLVAEKLLSCYPCTAGHMMDPEFKDSIMHQACKILRQAINCAAKKTSAATE